jgi:hypothetical protein
VRGLAKGPFRGSRDSRRLLALAFCSLVLVEVVIDSKRIVGSKGV